MRGDWGGNTLNERKFGNFGLVLWMDPKAAQNMQVMADLEIEMMTDLFNK